MRRGDGLALSFTLARLRIPHLYVAGRLAENEPVRLDPRAARHAAIVLRLRVGDALTLFDGVGHRYRSVIERIDRDGVLARPIATAAGPPEPRLQVTLGQSIVRGERMDFLVQKAVELGVRRIVPLTSERTVVRLTEARARRRQQHWQGIAIAAAEQCGRDTLPEIRLPTSLRRWLGQQESAHGAILSPNGGRRLRTLNGLTGEGFSVLVGPEGGFTTEEIGAAQARGYVAVRLGPRVLRSETAGIALLAAVHVLWGDLG